MSSDLTVKIVGAKYHPGAEALVAGLTFGQIVELVRDPANPHDANCVAVNIDGKLAGYIPKWRNRALADAMDAGCSVTAVATHNPGEILITWE